MLRFSISIREFFSTRILLRGINDSNFNSALANLPCYLLKGPLKRDFLDIYLTTFLESVNSKIHLLWLSPFFRKCSKLNLNLENAKKICENIFRFWHKGIWKCCNKLCLLRREYLSSAVNGLLNTLTILYITQRDLLNLSYLHKVKW